MKFIQILALVTSVAAVAIEPRQRCNTGQGNANNAVTGNRGGRGGNGGGRGGAGGNNATPTSAAVVVPPAATATPDAGDDGADTGNGGGDTGNGGGGNTGNGGNANTGGASDAVDGQTLVLFEINGVPGNECLTFRNNGEIVNAACVNTAADRQLTPSTLNNQPILRVQRTFTAGFRPDLVGVDVCVGFNGTAFRAEDCTAQGVELVSLGGDALKTAGGACANGHDDKAQVTVDEGGVGCASFRTTVVQPAAV